MCVSFWQFEDCVIIFKRGHVTALYGCSVCLINVTNVPLPTPQVNFLEDSLRSEDGDKGDMGARHRGVRKPQTTFKGPLLHVR